MSEADSTTPSPRLGRNGSSDGSSRAAIACARRRASRSASSRYSSSAEEPKISRCSAVTAWRIRAFTSRSASASGSALGPRDQRRELEQLEIPDDGVRDVEVGVEAKLPEPPARAHRPLEQLVAQQPVGGVERLGGPEQLLLACPPTRRRRPRAASTAARRQRRAAVVDARMASTTLRHARVIAA